MNSFLKKLFADGGLALEGRRISTHSCKATCISWCAKHDVSPEHRAILARHSVAALGPTALYSRDIITAALRSLEKVIQAVKGQMFFPDRTRSGMITPVPAPGAPVTSTPQPATPMPAAVEVVSEIVKGSDSVAPSPESPLDDTPKSWQLVGWPANDLEEVDTQHVDPPNLLADWDGDSEESSSCSDSESGEDMDQVEELASSSESRQTSVACSRWFINGRTLVNHERRNETTFKCGRAIGTPYFPVHQLTGLRCGKCFSDAL